MKSARSLQTAPLWLTQIPHRLGNTRRPQEVRASCRPQIVDTANCSTCFFIALPDKVGFVMPISRRSVIASSFASLGLGAFDAAEAAAQDRVGKNAPIPAKDNLKVTRLETFLVKPRWMFLKVHTNAGIVGYGEPITESRALTRREAVKEVKPYSIGKDPPRRASLAGLSHRRIQIGYSLLKTSLEFLKCRSMWAHPYPA